MTPEVTFKVGDQVRILASAFDADPQFKPLCGELAQIVACAAYWHPTSPPFKIAPAAKENDWAQRCGFPDDEAVDADGGFVWAYPDELEKVTT